MGEEETAASDGTPPREHAPAAPPPSVPPDLPGAAQDQSPEGVDEDSGDWRRSGPDPAAEAWREDASADEWSARPWQDEPADQTPADGQENGPTVTPDDWLGQPDPWATSGVRPVFRGRSGTVWRPRRFHPLPVWASGLLLAAVAAVALLAIVLVARTAAQYVPGHHSTVPASQHTPTPKTKRTPTPTR